MTTPTEEPQAAEPFFDEDGGKESDYQASLKEESAEPAAEVGHDVPPTEPAPTPEATPATPAPAPVIPFPGTPTPVPAAPIVPEFDQSAAMQQRMQEQARQISQYEHQNTLNQLQQAEQAEVRRLTARNIDPQTAADIARDRRRDHENMVHVQTQASQVAQEQQAKDTVARQIEQKTGAPLNELMQFNSHQAMIVYAQQHQRMAAMETELAKVRAGQAPPPQKFDTGQPTISAATSGRAKRMDQLTNKPHLSDAEHKELGELIAATG